MTAPAVGAGAEAGTHLGDTVAGARAHTRARAPAHRRGPHDPADVARGAVGIGQRQGAGLRAR